MALAYQSVHCDLKRTGKTIFSEKDLKEELGRFFHLRIDVPGSVVRKSKDLICTDGKESGYHLFDVTTGEPWKPDNRHYKYTMDLGGELIIRPV